MREQYKHPQLKIGLVSPEQIRAWATKTLPNGQIVDGEVKNRETIDYITKIPYKDGLFCQRIFGPIRSGYCACEPVQKLRKENENKKFCEKCEVEFVDPRIRRYQMGYIKLGCPVIHVWYFKRHPSYIANLLDKPLKELKRLAYCGSSFGRPTTKKPAFLRLRNFLKYGNQSWKYLISRFFGTEIFEAFRDREVGIGGDAIRQLLADLDLLDIIEDSRAEWKELMKRELYGETDEIMDELAGKEQEKQSGFINREEQERQRRKTLLLRRMELARHLLQKEVKPEWMVLYLLPVLPPELRPIIQIEGGQFISSDINELYKKVIEKNKIFNEALKIFPSQTLIYERRSLQASVDKLLGGRRKESMWNSSFKDYKSLSERLGGKEGRFRETLLGRRVDYSGRSVIVVGPSLALHQCGLPREIAIELFQAFLIRALIARGLASSVSCAKRMIHEREKEPIVWEILKDVVEGHPVLLNRAPTLHRLGILAFEPILVEGRAILLHPLVCKGFNADFDGDQMAVHLPLSLEAQIEARFLMFSHINLLSPAIGDPICVPTQDMLIGLYVLTNGNPEGILANRYNPYNLRKYQNQLIYNPNYKYNKEKEPFFASSYDALVAYRQKTISLNNPLWLRWKLVDLKEVDLLDGKEVDAGVIGSSEITISVIGSSEVPIEVQYESLGTSHEIYEDYLIIGSVKKEISCIYIRTTLGHISFFREIEEAIQGFSRNHSLRKFN